VECIETIEMSHGIVVKIHPDDSPDSPREWSNLGRMYWWHPDYTLGGDEDEEFDQSDHASMEDAARYLFTERKATCVLPLFLLDHSGISIRTGPRISKEFSTPRDLDSRDRFIGDAAGWDTTMVGFIYTTAELQEEIGTSDEHVEEALRGEIRALDQRFTGDVYGYVVEDEDGEHLDSCWGFYGMDDVRSEGKSAAEHYVDERVKVEHHNRLALAVWCD
jgi:hypothetical protein